MMGSNSTQQQLAAAMQAQQTQNLLAILQAQQLSSMNSGSLLPTPPGMGQRGKVCVTINLYVCIFSMCMYKWNIRERKPDIF